MGGAVFLSCCLFGVKCLALEPVGIWVKLSLGVKVDTSGRALFNITWALEFFGGLASWMSYSDPGGPSLMPSQWTKSPQAMLHGQTKKKRKRKIKLIENKPQEKQQNQNQTHSSNLETTHTHTHTHTHTLSLSQRIKKTDRHTISKNYDKNNETNKNKEADRKEEKRKRTNERIQTWEQLIRLK